jgi:hypothetical protein
MFFFPIFLCNFHFYDKIIYVRFIWYGRSNFFHVILKLLTLMPLPLQEESMTGFPVHVNGHFALSQNRRHVKWPTADQTRNKTHRDKSIRWNECLVTEVVPEVYIHILQELMDMCKRQSNPDIMVAQCSQMKQQC